MTSSDLSYDVRIWTVEIRNGARRTTYRVRWFVGASSFTEQFVTRKLADSFRAGLLQAASRGESFDRRTGRPRSEAVLARADRRWVEVAREFIDDHWDDFSPRHRKSTVEGLVRRAHGPRRLSDATAVRHPGQHEPRLSSVVTGP